MATDYIYLFNKRLKLSYLLGILIFLSLAVNLTMNLADGNLAPFAAVDTGFYTKYANVFMEQGFGGLIGSNLPVYYWGYPVILGILISLCGNSYALVIILLQIILISITTLSIYNIGKNVFSIKAGLLAVVLYVFTWEIFRWAHFVLTDGLYIVLFVNIVNLIILFRQTRSKLYLAILLVLSAMVALLRPTGLLLVLIVAMVVMWDMWKNRQYKWFLLGCGVILVGGVILISWGGAAADNRLSLQWFPHYFAQCMAKGQVIGGCPQYDYVFPGDLGSASLLAKIQFYFVLIVKRIMYFWAVYIGSHSFMHRLFNLCWLGPLFLSAFIGLVQSIREKIRPSYLFWLVLLAFTIFHALTDIESDQRYRAPLLTLVTIYSGLGLSWLHSVLIERIQKKPAKRSV